MSPIPAKQVGEVLWEIPKSYKPGMRVPARIYASKKLFQQMDEGVFNQVTNVACLSGIKKNMLIV
ncbi:MAG: RNA-splicing ligase RtcB, partial [Methanobacteriota archaeon]